MSLSCLTRRLSPFRRRAVPPQTSQHTRSREASRTPQCTRRSAKAGGSSRRPVSWLAEMGATPDGCFQTCPSTQSVFVRRMSTSSLPARRGASHYAINIRMGMSNFRGVRGFSISRKKILLGFWFGCEWAFMLLKPQAPP